MNFAKRSRSKLRQELFEIVLAGYERTTETLESVVDAHRPSHDGRTQSDPLSPRAATSHLLDHSACHVPSALYLCIRWRYSHCRRLVYQLSFTRPSCTKCGIRRDPNGRRTFRGSHQRHHRSLQKLTEGTQCGTT